MKTKVIKNLMDEIIDGMIMGIEFVDAVCAIYDNQENEEQPEQQSAPYFSDFEVVDETPKQLPE